MYAGRVASRVLAAAPLKQCLPRWQSTYHFKRASFWKQLSNQLRPPAFGPVEVLSADDASSGRYAASRHPKHCMLVRAGASAFGCFGGCPQGKSRCALFSFVINMLQTSQRSRMLEGRHYLRPPALFPKCAHPRRHPSPVRCMPSESSQPDDDAHERLADFAMRRRCKVNLSAPRGSQSPEPAAPLKRTSTQTAAAERTCQRCCRLMQTA